MEPGDRLTEGPRPVWLSHRDATDPVWIVSCRAAALCRIPDFAEDIAQRLSVEAWATADCGSPDLGRIEERARDFASKELTRRRANAAALRGLAESGSSGAPARRRSGRKPPPLCPRLALLAEPGRRGESFRRLVLQASLKAVGDGALRRGRKGRQSAFIHVYGAGRPVESVARSMRMTPRALVEMLRRASDAVERHLLREIESRVAMDLAAAERCVLAAHVRLVLQRFAPRETVPQPVKKRRTHAPFRSCADPTPPPRAVIHRQPCLPEPPCRVRAYRPEEPRPAEQLGCQEGRTVPDNRRVPRLRCLELISGRAGTFMVVVATNDEASWRPH